MQQLASRAVDEVRRSEWRRLRGTDDARSIKHMRCPYCATRGTRRRPSERLSALPERNPRALPSDLLREALAEIYRNLYTPPWARRRLAEWIAWAARSRLDPFRKVARTFKRSFDRVLAYFATGLHHEPRRRAQHQSPPRHAPPLCQHE